jgi:hypothetical protein
MGFLTCTRVAEAFTFEVPLSFNEERVVLADELRIRFPGMVLTVRFTNARRPGGFPWRIPQLGRFARGSRQHSTAVKMTYYEEVGSPRRRTSVTVCLASNSRKEGLFHWQSSSWMGASNENRKLLIETCSFYDQQPYASNI